MRVRFLQGSVSFHKKVLQIASEWSNYCGVEFDLSTDSRSEIRVGFETNRLSKDYGHFSYIGVESRDVARDRSMNLAITEVSLERNEYHQAVVRHEFGHAWAASMSTKIPVQAEFGSTRARRSPTSSVSTVGRRR